MHRRRADLKEVLVRSLPKTMRQRVFSVELVQRCWVRAVGEELARRSEPEALNNGVLTVRVTDATWGRMIYQLQGDIIPTLNEVIGMRLVRRINFTKRSRLQNLVPLPEEPTSPDPDPPAVPESIRRASDGIEDEDLRELVCRSASRYLRAQSKEPKQESRNSWNE